jgi:hypothetical protein
MIISKLLTIRSMAEIKSRFMTTNFDNQCIFVNFAEW